MSVDIDKLKDLAQAATPGPWDCREADGLSAIAHPLGWLLESDDEQECADKRFIAAANPAAVLELIAELERCRESATRQTGERIISALEAMIPAVRGEETAKFLRDLVAEWRGTGGAK